MGQNFLDQYSFLHFATGVIAYFFHIPIHIWIILHIIFEILENTSQGVYFIDHYLKFWPGGKVSPDSFINSVSDTIFSILGWYVAYVLEKYFTS